MRWADVDAVLFDLDGTLVDSAPGLGRAVDEMRIARGLDALPLDRYRPMAGAGARGMLSVAFDLTPDDAAFDEMRSEFFERYERCVWSETPVFDGIVDVLGALARQCRSWGVVTNKSVRFTEPLTSALTMFERAGAIVSGDTTPHAKPHPAPLLEAARRLGVVPHRCIYVGDDERDIVAGRAAGMRTVAAKYGYLGAQADVGRWNADAVILSPIELLNLLEPP
ncbi:MAG: HAD family hydrolase [Comamonadaceae bacterium]|nr:MAG: HAD family hydrolase [Comamonadaceae bacterium]